jgi:hypothetical protein
MNHVNLTTAESAGSSSSDWDDFWDLLLPWVEDGSVIPIVGQDLLALELDGVRVSLDTYLAERLAQALGQGPPSPAADEPPLAEPLTLNRVIYRFLKQKRPIERIYVALAELLKEEGANAIPVPQPLLQLADIDPFRIFVTTTFDPLLERALRKKRPGVRLRVERHSVKEWQESNDLPDDFEPTSETFLYHLLGRLSNEPQDFTVTEEDLLEFLHSLNSRPPASLFAELASEKKHLLIIGTSFSEWLARFFIRLPKKQRLWSLQSSLKDFLADPHLQGDVSLGPFLESFCRHAMSFRGLDAVAFVDELHTRWVARGRRSLLPRTARRGAGKIFLSYANEDLAAVEKIRARLVANNLGVWIDTEQLRGGENFPNEIKRAIEKCFVFIPVLSPHTRDWQDRYYRQEWDWALRRMVRLPANRKLIVPVAIEDMAHDDETLPEGIRQLTWIHLPHGEPDDGFLAQVKNVFQQAQKPPRPDVP